MEHLIHFGDRENSLYLAAKEGNLDIIIQHVEIDPKIIDSLDEDLQSPLLIACSQGHYKIVKYLVELGADVNISDKSGCTPLIKAIIGGYIMIVQFLLVKGADINKAENSGLTPFLVSCASGHLDIAIYLRDNWADIYQSENNGYTPIILASGGGHLEVVKYLKDAGVDINKPSKNGFTAIFTASGAGHLDVVMYLEQSGAEIDSCSCKGSTPFYIACVNGHLDIVKYLKNTGADIEKPDNNGLTPLHAAVGAGQSSIKVFAFLIYSGCDITKKDKNNRTPLDYSRRDPIECLHSIISTYWHETMFHKAVYHNDISLLRTLLDDDGSNKLINAVGKNAWTPLHYASFFNRTEAAEILLESGADPNLIDFNKQQTALHIATSRGNFEIVRLIHKFSNNTRRYTNSFRNISKV